jgi:diadenosine tetraphosphate (Ap4A) HIT family hydrolase
MNAPRDTLIHRRVAALRAGHDPACVARLISGWVVLGDPQVIPGYCLLLPDPVVPQLNSLDGPGRAAFLADMARVGDVLLAAMAATRINYAIFGNLDPALHAHVFPRRQDEPAALVTAQPWAYDWHGAPRFTHASHAALLERLRRAFTEPA